MRANEVLAISRFGAANVGMVRIFFVLLAFSFAARAEFQFSRETFSFANDTLWSYDVDATGQLSHSERAAQKPYTRHCIVMIRGAMQFHRFASFAPDAPKITEAEYRKKVRAVARTRVTSKKRVRAEIPGYASLREFSKAHPRLLQDELGLWWPTYFRFGNHRMASPFPGSVQKQLAVETRDLVGRGEVVALFITRFRPLNHVVLVHGVNETPDGSLRFACYDPNDPSMPITLTFNAPKNRFFWPKTGYWPGGQVNAFRIYRNWVW